MPKNLFQAIVMSIIMTFCMVYAMATFNSAIDHGGLSNAILVDGFKRTLPVWPIAFIIEFAVVERLAMKLAFKFINPEDKQIFVILGISSMIVVLMCPIMSFVTAAIFSFNGPELLSPSIQRTVINFPMALMVQIFFFGPIVRFIMSVIFPEKNNK